MNGSEKKFVEQVLFTCTNCGSEVSMREASFDEEGFTTMIADCDTCGAVLQTTFKITEV